jgi:hypothetical protein
MGKLKPIGSEKLTGDSKLKRMLEIARYNENTPSNVNETAKSEYGITLSDGIKYEIVKEKQGYIVKRTISESETEYIEPMKNRRYHSSYSQALKRLNLLAGELNRLNENVDGTSLFGEQKKFVLKTPNPPAPAPAPAPETPPAVPEPEMPVAEPSMDEPMPDEGMEVPPPADDMPDAGMEGPQGEEGVPTFKSIQKLTGKLAQKIRTLVADEGMTSSDMKYVINMVLSSLDLNNLEDEDKEEILMKFEGEEEMGTEDMGGEDITSDTEVEDIQADMDTEIPTEGEMFEDMEDYDFAKSQHMEDYDEDFESLFGESKVDNVITKYFEMTKKELDETIQRKKQKLTESERKNKFQMNKVIELSETIEQELSSSKFLEENSKFNFVGKTNKNNLVFEYKTKQVRITPQGLII